MQAQQPPDPDIYLWNMKVNKLEAMAMPLRSLLRSASARADFLSPFSSNPAHQPVSTPATPAASAAAASSFGCMTATPTDTPPATPKDANNKAKAAATGPAAMSSFASLWSPRRLMQRAARAFRISSSRSRRRMKGDEPGPGVPVIPGRASDVASGGSMDVEHGSSDGNNGGAAAAAAVDKIQQEEEDPQQQHVEEAVPVPEKIIHVAHHQEPEPVVEEAEACEKAADEKENGDAAAAAAEEEKEEEPKKGAAPEPEAVAEADMADKFVVVVKEAMKRHEEETDTKKEAMAKFQGRRVKTAMEARGESEIPRRREVARSNEVIEEACTKFLAKRQGSRVRALVGAFETVMDAKPTVAAGKPKHHYRQSA